MSTLEGKAAIVTGDRTVICRPVLSTAHGQSDTTRPSQLGHGGPALPLPQGSRPTWPVGKYQYRPDLTELPIDRVSQAIQKVPASLPAR
jgi:hypothetical protein